MRKYLALVTCIALCIFAVAPAMASIPVLAIEDKTEEELTDAEYAEELLAEMMEINAILKPCGLSLTDLQEIPVKEPAFYEGLKELVMENKTNSAEDGYSIQSSNSQQPGKNWERVFNPEADPEKSEESKISASMWGYAYEMATLNLQRVRKEKGLPPTPPSDDELFEETKNMYMSHYVDLKSGPEYQVVKSRSDDGYFSSWITDLDRQQYEIYLKNAKLSAAILATSKVVAGVYSSVGSIKQLKGLTSLRQKKDIAKMAVADLDTGTTCKTIIDEFPDMKAALKSNNDPKKFVEDLNRTLALESYEPEIKNVILDSLIAICTVVADGTFGGLLSPIISMTRTFYSHVIKDFYDKARWIDLIYSNNMRVGKRVERYYKYEYGIGLGSFR